MDTVTFETGKDFCIVDSPEGKLHVQVARGPAGTSVKITRVLGSKIVPITVSLSTFGESEHVNVDASELSCTLYKDTPEAQAFKKWYAEEAVPLKGF